MLTQRGSPPDTGDPNNDTNRRIEVLEAQALQLHLSGWTQAIALYVHPEYRHHRIASHLLRSAKRALVEQANVSIGFIGNPHVSAAALWAKVGARFYIGRELPDEELFAITWGRRDACGMLLDMFARCADYPRDQGAAASKADDDFEIPF